MLRAMHFREPGYSRSHLDRLCALVGVGRIDDASTFAAELRTQAHATGRPSAAAVALTGEALVAAHSDRVDDAQRMFDDVIAWYDTSPLRIRPRPHAAARGPGPPASEGQSAGARRDARGTS